MAIIVPEATPERTEILVLFDLRDPAAWERGRSHREPWGKGLTHVDPMGLDHVLIAFRRGGGNFTPKVIA